MVILLVAGVMNLGAMAVVTAAITVERLAPAGEQSARAIGVDRRRGGIVADHASHRARVIGSRWRV